MLLALSLALLLPIAKLLPRSPNTFPSQNSTTMRHKAVVCRSTKGWKDLQVEEVETLGDDAVLVDVKACSLNYPDTLIT